MEKAYESLKMFRELMKIRRYKYHKADLVFMKKVVTEWKRVRPTLKVSKALLRK